MKTLLKNPCTWFSLLWILYYLQGHLYSSAIIGTGVISLYILISLYYCIYANLNYDLPRFYKAINYLVVLFTIYGVIRIVENKELYRLGDVYQNPTVFLKNYYISLLPLYTFLVFKKHGYVTADWLKKISLVFLLFITYRYFILQREVLAASVYEVEGITNNIGYLFVSLMLILPLYKKPIVQYSLLLYLVFFSISSMKRGALLCVGMCLVYFIWENLRHNKNANKGVLLLATIAVLFGIYYFVGHLLENNDFFISRMNQTLEGDSSGRKDLYTYFWNTFIHQSDMFLWLFGYGADGTIALFNQFAHNDWLEIGINHGILGIGLYLFYWISFAKNVNQIKYNRELFSIAMLAIIPLLLKSFFSMSITDFQPFQCALIAYCFADDELNYKS